MNWAVSRNYARSLDSNRTQLKRSSLACTNTLVIFKMMNGFSSLFSYHSQWLYTRVYFKLFESLWGASSLFLYLKKNYRYFINYEYQTTDDIGLVQDNIEILQPKNISLNYYSSTNSHCILIILLHQIINNIENLVR